MGGYQNHGPLWGPLNRVLFAGRAPSSGICLRPDHAFDAPSSTATRGGSQDLSAGSITSSRAPKRPHKDQDPTNHEFCHSPDMGALEPEGEILICPLALLDFYVGSYHHMLCFSLRILFKVS